MVEFIKKNKKITISSSIFVGINNLNNNIFGQCSGKYRKDKNSISGSTSSGYNVSEDENQSGDKNPKKGNPTQNPPTQNSPQDNLTQVQQLYQKFCDLYEFCKKNENKYIDDIQYNLDSIKNCADKLKKDNNIEGLKSEITLFEKIKKNIEWNIAKEQEEKNKDPNKDKDEDKDEIGEIHSIFNDIESVDIEENYDLTGININFINKDKFSYKNFKNGSENKKSLIDGDFIKLENLIKNFLAKKKLKGNFTVDYIEPDHSGVNPILKIKITNNDDPKTIFFAFIKNECINDYMLIMFKGFQILDLLPFEYYIDLKNNLMITEDVVENGFSFLDNEIKNITEKNKKMWSECKNMNEFRFWCYLLVCDDIDPMYKFDNCCFKDNKVHALDIRINRIVNLKLGEYKILDVTLQKNYDEFMKYCFSEINSNDIPDDYKTTSDHYKIWENSIDNFKDFTDDEKKSINEKLIKLLSYFIGICKHYNWENNITIMNQTNYIKQVIRNIMNFLSYYVNKYKEKFIKFEYKNETLTGIYNSAKFGIQNYSYEKADFIFKKLIDDKKSEFNYFLNPENLVKLYDIHRNIPHCSDVYYILPDINFGV